MTTRTIITIKNDSGGEDRTLTTQDDGSENDTPLSGKMTPAESSAVRLALLRKIAEIRLKSAGRRN